MRFITSTITLVVELTVLILSIVWRIRTGEEEPLIGIVTASGTLLISIITKFTTRPKIVLHHRWTDSGRWQKGFTENNPSLIHVGVDLPDYYWRLNWNYVLEIRNNSSQTAYYLQINYQNLPDKTFIEGDIGKIEPIQPHELREFNIKIVQNITGTHVDADRYLQENPNILTKDFLIEIKYKDESGFRFRTRYSWLKDENRLLIL